MENSSKNEFYTAVQNDSEYHSVCDIRKKKGRSNTNVLNAFSGLECPARELYEWDSKRKEYTDHFRKAKQCLERRLTRMKKFKANTNESRETRKRHAYPIKVAYAYGKNCLKKVGSQRQRNIFERSVNTLVSQIAETQSNIKNHFGNSIENSIRERGDRNYIRELLDKSYYDGEQQAVINRERNSGLYRLKPENQDLYQAIFNEGFERNSEFPTLLQEVANENENENEAPNETKIRPAAITLRRKALKKKKKTLKKSFHHKVANLRNLNALINSNLVRITDEEKKRIIKQKINELKDLYIAELQMNMKANILEKILRLIISPGRKDLVTKMYENLTKEVNASKKLLSKKDAKKAMVLMDKPEVKLFNVFRDILNTFIDTADQYEKKSKRLSEDLSKKKKTGNAQINSELDYFYNKSKDEYILNLTYDELDSLPKERLEKFNRDATILLDSIEQIRDLSYTLDELETTYTEIVLDLSNIPTEVTKLESSIERLKTLKGAIKNRPNNIAKANSKIAEQEHKKEELIKQMAELKGKQDETLSKYFDLYKARNEILEGINMIITKGVSNPLMLSGYLEENIIQNRMMKSIKALLTTKNAPLLALNNAENTEANV
jgi:hypothetical protein